MKRWIIVEDRPWVMTDFIQDVKRKAQDSGQGYCEPDILYYIAGDNQEQRDATENNYRKNVSDFEKNTGIVVKRIDKTNFNAQMEEYYKRNCIIFMDLNLTGSNAMYFNERNNVQYAREKQQESQKNGEREQQIWFYTTGASLDANFLRSEFPDNVIEVINFEDGKAHLDKEKSWELLCDNV